MDAAAAQQTAQILAQLVARPIKTITGNVTMTDDGPMWCIATETPRPGTYWLLLFAGVTGTLQTQPIVSDMGTPTNGLFIVQANVQPESLALAQGTTGFYPGIDLLRRGVPLPMECQSPPSGSDGSDPNSPAYFFSCTLDSPQPVPIPYGYTLAGAYTPNPGTPVPGPGAGSRCVLNAFVIEVETGPS